MGAPFQWRLKGLYADRYGTYKGHSRHQISGAAAPLPPLALEAERPLLAVKSTATGPPAAFLADP